MKVVLFCGGQGLRLPRHSETIPKPMAIIGYRPILWHVMRYYAHHGQSDFLLCLGYRGDLVKSYFLAYNEALSTACTPTAASGSWRSATTCGTRTSSAPTTPTA